MIRKRNYLALDETVRGGTSFNLTGFVNDSARHNDDGSSKGKEFETRCFSPRLESRFTRVNNLT